MRNAFIDNTRLEDFLLPEIQVLEEMGGDEDDIPADIYMEAEADHEDREKWPPHEDRESWTRH